MLPIGPPERNALQTRIPRKSFLSALLGGAALLAPLSKTARAQSHRVEMGAQSSVTPTPTDDANVATKVMVIRHAEKPTTTLNGIDESGNPDSGSLIPQGWQRAGALVPLFNSSFGPLPTPSHIFAPNLFTTGSKRPFETVTPLAAKLGITINATPEGVSPGQYNPTQWNLMVPDALSCPGLVLIAWEHEYIPSLANLILGNSTTVPQAWPSERFDVVWTFDLNPATNTYTFNQLPQLLLQGDLTSPIF